MKFEIKEPDKFIKKLQQLNEVITEAIITSCKEKVIISGMNQKNTILLTLDINKSFLKTFKPDTAKGYIINITHLLSALNKLTNGFMLEFKEQTLTIKSKGKRNNIVTIPVLPVATKYKSPKLKFKAEYQLTNLKSLFGDLTIKAAKVYPILLENNKDKYFKLSCVLAPKHLR